MDADNQLTMPERDPDRNLASENRVVQNESSPSIGTTVIDRPPTEQDLCVLEQSLIQTIADSDGSSANVYVELGDVRLKRYFKYDSTNRDLLRMAIQAYWDALDIDPAYSPAKSNLGVIRRYLKLSGDLSLMARVMPTGSTRELGIFQYLDENGSEVKPETRKSRLLSLQRFLSNWRNIVPLLMVSFFFVVAILAPVIAPPMDTDNPLPFRYIESKDLFPYPPGPGMPLGTSIYFVPGRTSTLLHYDVYHSLIWGMRDAISFGLAVALFSALLGTFIGAVSGYTGGIFNNISMRITDAFLAFPIIAGVWLIQQLIFSFEFYSSFLGSFYPGADAIFAPLSARQQLISALGISPVFIAFILFSWMPYARLINVGFLRLKSTDYVIAARTIGARHWGLIFRHLLPNAITPVIVLLARDIGAMVVLRAAFSFIGMGGSIEGGLPEWDRLLLLGRTYVIGVGGNILVYWWLYLPVTLALILFGVSWNLFGDRLNVLLNPREVN